MHASDATERFSHRVADYVRYRPDYPLALLDRIHHEFDVTPRWRIADIGAGTGISSKLFLDAGHTVIAVEPNTAMREAAVAWLGTYPGFCAIAGRADATGLPDASIDLVASAQAFHWFDPETARREFRRILRPGGIAVIWWNSRRPGGSRFLDGYEALLRRFGTDYATVAGSYPDDARMRGWFGGGLRGTACFEHEQRLDFEALRGRLLSSSYTPRAGEPGHAPMLRALRELFDTTATNDAVTIDYDTRVFAGGLA